MHEKSKYAGRGGDKLRHVIDVLALDPTGRTAADLGCNVGGFTDCLLRAGACRVYSVDTGYGTLDWKLRNDPRVTVMERTNALHVELPEQVDIVASDVAWTKQERIVPAALRLLASGGVLLSLFKPQYEAPPRLVKKGIVAPEHFEDVLASVLDRLKAINIPEPRIIPLPASRSGKNLEAFLFFRRQT